MAPILSLVPLSRKARSPLRLEGRLSVTVPNQCHMPHNNKWETCSKRKRHVCSSSHQLLDSWEGSSVSHILSECRYRQSHCDHFWWDTWFLLGPWLNCFLCQSAQEMNVSCCIHTDSLTVSHSESYIKVTVLNALSSFKEESLFFLTKRALPLAVAFTMSECFSPTEHSVVSKWGIGSEKTDILKINGWITASQGLNFL